MGAEASSLAQANLADLARKQQSLRQATPAKSMSTPSKGTLFERGTPNVRQPDRSPAPKSPWSGAALTDTPRAAPKLVAEEVVNDLNCIDSRLLVTGKTSTALVHLVDPTDTEHPIMPGRWTAECRTRPSRVTSDSGLLKELGRTGKIFCPKCLSGWSVAAKARIEQAGLKLR